MIAVTSRRPDCTTVPCRTWIVSDFVDFTPHCCTIANIQELPAHFHTHTKCSLCQAVALAESICEDAADAFVKDRNWQPEGQRWLLSALWDRVQVRRRPARGCAGAHRAKLCLLAGRVCSQLCPLRPEHMLLTLRDLFRLLLLAA